MKNKFKRLSLLGASFIALGATTIMLSSCACNKPTSHAEIVNLEVERKPKKTEYIVGDKLDLTGIVVNKVMSDGSWKKLDKTEYKTVPEEGSVLTTANEFTKVEVILLEDTEFTQEFNICVNPDPTPIIEQTGKVVYTEVGDGYKVSGLSNASSKIKTITVDAIHEGKPVVEIEKGALKGCPNLQTLTLPFIGKDASAVGTEALFGYCFGDVMYDGCGSFTYQEYDANGSTVYQKYAIPNSLTTVEITNATQIPAGAFSNCKYIENITINPVSNAIYIIGNKAFYYCSSLESFDFSVLTGLAEIEKSAFERCINLESASIPNTVNCIRESAFAYCISAASIYVPANVSLVEKNAFSNCYGGVIATEASEDYIASHWEEGFAESDVVFIYDFNKGNSIKYISDWLILVCGSDHRGEGGSDDRYVYLSQWMGNWQQATITIPGSFEIDGETIPVKVLGTKCFQENIYIQTLNFEEGCEVIYPNAFENCTLLSQVTFPNSLLEIRDEAFKGCTSLRGSHVGDLPSNVLSFPKVKNIGKQAFYGCTNIWDLELKEVVTIQKEAFAYCSHLCPDNRQDETHALEIPYTCTTLEEGAFKYCFKYVPEGFTASTYYPTIRFARSKDGLDKAPQIKVIPESCFEKCGVRVLTSTDGDDKGTIYPKYIRTNVDLGGAHLTRIEDAAFKNFYMKKLSGARYTHLEYIGDYAFYYAQMTSSEEGEFDKQDLQMDQEIKYIGDYAFAYCSTVSALTFNTKIDGDETVVEEEKYYNSLEHLGKYAFYGCNNMNFTTLDLAPCTNLKVWTKGEQEGTYDVENTSKYAFSGCSNLKIVRLPGCKSLDATKPYPQCTSFTRIAERMFDSCVSIGKGSDGVPLEIPENVTDFRYACFCNCTYLKTCYIAGKVNYFGSSLFANCTNLETLTKNSDGDPVEFDENISNNNIGTGIFSKCERLTNPPIPLGPTETKDYDLHGSTYLDNKSLTEFEFPINTRTIGSSCFQGCENLATLTFKTTEDLPQNRLYRIYDNAFNGCSSLQHVDLTKTLLEAIYDKAFANCSNLLDVTLPDRKITFNSQPFDTLTSTTKIKFGRQSVKDYASTVWDSPQYFYWANNPSYKFTRCGSAGSYYYTCENLGGVSFVCYTPEGQ